jgi:protein-tyrosine phosphatase
VLARAAAQAGIEVVVATPHIREDYPFDPAEIGVRARELEGALAEADIPLQIVEGAEVAISRVPELDEGALQGLCLGDGPYMLVESPYVHASELLENTLFELQVQGFRPVLAHPERCPSFQRDPDRLAELVERGMLCSVTSSSMRGSFGGTVKRFTALLFSRGLVHNVASDAHDAVRRSIDLRSGFVALDGELRGLGGQAAWFTAEVPAAILAGQDVRQAPRAPALPARGWRRLLGR